MCFAEADEIARQTEDEVEAVERRRLHSFGTRDLDLRWDGMFLSY